MSPKSLEVSGTTVDDAITKGLAALGLARDAVEVEILREGSRGVLGIGEDALVRLSARAQPEAVGAGSAPVQDVSTPAGDSRLSPEQYQETARQALDRILRGMGLNARVEILPDLASQEAHAFVLNIVGGDLGILIGRRGETLRDLEYLTRLIAAQLVGKQVKLVVDVEGYRTRRERVLHELAKRMAERVQSNRQPITLEAMPPNERRIVHIALREHPAVTTQSIGEGEHRRVMILPK